MRYTKPQINPLASAVNAVQSSTDKSRPVTQDGSINLGTSAAYEADE
jgi:hypothetical protein